MSDDQIEAEITKACEVMVDEGKSTAERIEASERMKQLHQMRRPEVVKQMEAEQGLRNDL